MSDWRMAAVFGANTLCCLIILGLTAWKRAAFKAARDAPTKDAPLLEPDQPVAGALRPLGSYAGRAP
jgi:hypothetical protein